MKNKFDIFISIDMSNINELISSENVYVACLIQNNIILSCYLFRKSCLHFKGFESLICFVSINNTSDENFIHGFKLSFWVIAEKYYYGYCIIENLSDNHIIIDNLLLKTKPDSKSLTAYFFYNFAYSSFNSQNVFILN